MGVRSVLVVGLLLFPQLIFAAVSISEVAWMGTAVSPNHEWIELHNTGSAVDVTGWTVTDGMNLSIVLEGTIPAESYVVLERTSDASAPGAAFHIYTGALVNTGSALYLKRADGSLVDQVSGGEDWQNIGGDNVTKETAQYTSAGWITAPATPGRGLTDSEISSALNRSETTTTTTAPKTTKSTTAAVTKKSVSEPVRLVVPGVTLRLLVTAQTVGYVHQPIKFSATPTGIGDTLIASLSYEWNFGDGNSAVGKEGKHVYQYPGTYVVTVYAGYKRQEQVARHEITILPVMLSLTKNQTGDMQINNDSPYEIDLSGYRVKGDKEFTFPPRTIILPNQTITIPKSKVGTTDNRLVAIYDTEAALVASSIPGKLTAAIAVATDDLPVSRIGADTDGQPVVAIVPVEANMDFGFSIADAESVDEEKLFSVPNTAWPASVAAASEDSSVDKTAVAATAYEKWPYVALVVVLLISIAGLFATPRKNNLD